MMIPRITPSLKHFDLEQLEGQQITSYGRVTRVDQRKEFYFLRLRTADRLDDVSVTAKKSQFQQPPTRHSSVQFTGLVKRAPDGKSLEVEMLELLHYGHFDPAALEVDFKMPIEVVRGRESQRLLLRHYQCILFMYQLAERYLAEVSHDLGLLRVRVPAITFSDCEGAGELFKVSTEIPGFFAKQPFLTVSGQVDEETVTSRLLCPTYTFGRSFRADPSDTRYHVCEFEHYEPEVPYITLDGLMDLEESTIRKLLARLLTDPEAVTCLGHLKRPVSDLEAIRDGEFARVSYTEAVEIIRQAHHASVSDIGTPRFTVCPKWGDDLGKEHERYLCEQHFKRPTFVYRYPRSLKSFYMYVSDQTVEVDGVQHETVDAVDLLVPGIGELCGGSIREHRPDRLVEQIQSKGLVVDDYEGYLRLAREGGFPHGGYGLGFDRLIMFVTGASHIRDVTAFPRYYQHLGEPRVYAYATQPP